MNVVHWALPVAAEGGDELRELEPVLRLDVFEPLFGGANTTKTTAAATKIITTTTAAASLGNTPLARAVSMGVPKSEVS